MKRIAWLSSVLSLAFMIGFAEQGLADVKVGDVITRQNMHQAQALLAPGTQWMLQQGMVIKVAETKPIELPKIHREATEKYARQVRIAADGRTIFNYVAGTPFPDVDVNDPLAPHKVMWNVTFNDNVGANWAVDVVDGWGDVSRAFESDFRRMMWIGRLYLDPKPVIPHNPPLLYTEQYGPLLNPSDLRGTSALVFRYLATNQPDDTYLYQPEFRRIRRVSMANRSDALFGTDMDMDSLWGWNAKLSFWSFRLLAKKEVLAVMHSGKYGDPKIWCAPRDSGHGLIAAMPCVPWEKRNVWVIEARPTGYGSGYGYAKRIIYVDDEAFHIPFSEHYDSNDALHKVWQNFAWFTSKPYQTYPENPRAGANYNYNDEWPFIPNGFQANIASHQASTWEAPSTNAIPRHWQNEWYFNEPVRENSPQGFSINYLIQNSH